MAVHGEKVKIPIRQPVQPLPSISLLDDNSLSSYDIKEDKPVPVNDHLEIYNCLNITGDNYWTISYLGKQYGSSHSYMSSGINNSGAVYL